MKLFCASLFVLFGGLGAFAQAGSAKKTITSDTISTIDTAKFSILQTGISYGNTTNYYGQTTADKLGYASLDLAYKYKLGFWAAASAIKLVDIDQPVSEFDLAIGYDINISKRLGASASYTRFFFAKNSPLPQSINPNTASLGLNYDLKLLSSSLNADYVFGKLKDTLGNRKNVFFLTLNSSKEIDLGQLSKKDYITFTPSVAFIGGTQRIGPSEEESNSKKQSSGGTINPFDNLDGKGNGKNPARILNPGGGKTKPTRVQPTSFQLVTTSLNLPLAYNRAHYTVEAAYQLSIPNKNLAGIVYENQSFFTLSFTYVFYKDK